MRIPVLLAAAALGAAGAATIDRSAAETGVSSAAPAFALAADGHPLAEDVTLHPAGDVETARAATAAVQAERRLQQVRASRAAERQRLDREATRVATARAEAAAAAEARRAVFPLEGRLTSSFGPRWGTTHWGIDIAAPMLDPEYAAAAGTVLQAGPASGFGNAIYIEHANGDVTVYGHMEEVLVTAGQTVAAGDLIARVGSRGYSTGPHLHFEVYQGGLDGQRVDPLVWLAERGAVP